MLNYKAACTVSKPPVMHHIWPQAPNVGAPVPQGRPALEDSSVVSQPADRGAAGTHFSVEGSLQAKTNALCHFD